jgi:hypothetical protein
LLLSKVTGLTRWRHAPLQVWAHGHGPRAPDDAPPKRSAFPGIHQQSLRPSIEDFWSKAAVRRTAGFKSKDQHTRFDCWWWEEHSPSMFQLLLSPATTTPLANGSPWHHRHNVGSANHRPAQFRADLAWRSRRVVSPHELWRRVLSVHRPSVVCRLSPTGTSAWLPFDNTTDADPPRFFNWKGLHLTNYPASDVLCRRTDTVARLAVNQHPAL